MVNRGEMTTSNHYYSQQVTINNHYPESPQDIEQIKAMLRQLLLASGREVQRDLIERERDMASEAELLALAQETNDFTNRAAAALTGIKSDIEALLNRPEVPDSVKTAFAASLANLSVVAAGLEATDSAYPPTEPTPTPAPTEPTEVPPVEEAPGTEANPIPNP